MSLNISVDISIIFIRRLTVMKKRFSNHIQKIYYGTVLRYEINLAPRTKYSEPLNIIKILYIY